MMLPFVVAYNAVDEATARIYGELARETGLCEQGCDDVEALRVLRGLYLAPGSAAADVDLRSAVKE